MSDPAPELDCLRSGCPITCALDLLGDRWTLVVLRDVLLGGRTRFAEFARAEGIASNVLADRLARLERSGLLQRSRDPDDGRRRIYRPTERAVALLPVLLELMVWGFEHGGGSAKPELVAWARRDRASMLEALRERITTAAEGAAPNDAPASADDPVGVTPS